MKKDSFNKTSAEFLENHILNRINKNAIMSLSMFQAMDAFESTRENLILLNNFSFQFTYFTHIFKIIY